MDVDVAGAGFRRGRGFAAPPLVSGLCRHWWTRRHALFREYACPLLFQCVGRAMWWVGCAAAHCRWCLSCPVGRPGISILTHVESFPKASASTTNLSLPLYASLYAFSFILASQPDQGEFLISFASFPDSFPLLLNQPYTTVSTHTPTRVDHDHTTSTHPLPSRKRNFTSRTPTSSETI